MSQVIPFLMFDNQLEVAIFPDARVENIARAGENGPVQSAELILGGRKFIGFNGGPHFKFSEGFSLFVDCEDQAEVDRYWNKLVEAGAKPVQCGWITDPFGLSWQIVPRRFTELMRDPDPERVHAVMQAMLKMVKLEVAELERAYRDA